MEAAPLGRFWFQFAGLMAVLLLLYKHFVHAPGHRPRAHGPMVALATAILFAPIVWAAAGRAGRIMCVTVDCRGGCCHLFDPLLLHRPRPAGICDECAARCLDNIKAAVSLVMIHPVFPANGKAARQLLRDEENLPLDKIFGHVDVYPIARILSLPMTFSTAPRPVVRAWLHGSFARRCEFRHLRGHSAPQRSC